MRDQTTVTDHEKWRVRYQVKLALKEGRVTRKPCEICGNANSVGHHEDYDKPLDLTWLCRKHHNARHQELGWGTLKPAKHIEELKTRVPSEMKRQLSELADQNGVTVSMVVRKAIHQYLQLAAL